MESQPQRPFEVDAEEYPFGDHWFPYRGSQIHYVDEGEGPVVVLLHGNPTWSYLYRNIIKELRGECRLVAPDYPGFGMSKPPADYDFEPAEHSAAVTALIDFLGLEDITLVLQDWGGPIGMRHAVDHSDEIRAIVLLNTWVFQASPLGWFFSALMGGWPLGWYLQTRKNLFASKIVPGGIFHKDKVTPSLRRAYTDPFPTPDSRVGTWVFPRAIRTASKWLADIEGRLGGLEQTPVEMVWAMQDKAFGSEAIIKRWQGYLRNNALERLDDADHYLQEDRPDRIVAAVRRALERSAG